MKSPNLDCHGQCMQLCSKFVWINFDKKMDLVA